MTDEGDIVKRSDVDSLLLGSVTSQLDVPVSLVLQSIAKNSKNISTTGFNEFTGALISRIVITNHLLELIQFFCLSNSHITLMVSEPQSSSVL